MLVYLKLKRKSSPMVNRKCTKTTSTLSPARLKILRTTIDNIYQVDVININTEDGDSTQPIPVTQTNIVVLKNSPTTIQLQSVPAAPTDDTDGDGINDILDNSPFVANPEMILMETVWAM